MLKMRVHGLIAAGVTLLHFTPPSVVTEIVPSSVPVQMIPMFLLDSDIAVIAPAAFGVTLDAYLPAVEGTPQVAPRVRSPLMRVQLCARSVLFHTTFDA